MCKGSLVYNIMLKYIYKSTSCDIVEIHTVISNLILGFWFWYLYCYTMYSVMLMKTAHDYFYKQEKSNYYCYCKINYVGSVLFAINFNVSSSKQDISIIWTNSFCCSVKNWITKNERQVLF